MGAWALVVFALLMSVAYGLGGRSASDRDRDFERACEALHRARLGERGAFAEARAAFLSARGRFYEGRSAELGVSVVDALEAAVVEPTEPFLRAIARRDDRAAEEHARRVGGSMADDGARLASSLARVASRAAATARDGRRRAAPGPARHLTHLSPRGPGAATFQGAH